ncbi:hypothetical protein TSMEX_006444 [Taenia solium]|eukprot:TsM_000993900 transcript=TsM_000993900 gene=TsM_000993900
MFSRLLGPFLSSEAPYDALKSIGATLELQRQEALDRQEQALMDLRRIQFVNIQNLVDMGFLEERSHLALTVAHGDIYEAINLLQDPSFDLH